MKTLARATAMAALGVLVCSVSPGAADEKRPSFVAQHLVQAEVSRIDLPWVFLKTAGGRLKLDVSGHKNGAFKNGERLTLDVRVIRHPDPETVPRGPESQRPHAVQRFRADVTGIQRAIGVVSLRSPAGQLSLDLPSEAIAGMRTGDQLTLELGIAADTDPAALAGPSTQRRSGLAALWFAITGRRR